MSVARLKHRTVTPIGRTDAEKLRIAVRRDLAQVTHIPGDLTAEEIDRRFRAALRRIRYRRYDRPA